MLHLGFPQVNGQLRGATARLLRKSAPQRSRTPRRRQDSITERIAATFGPDCALPTCSLHRRANRTEKLRRATRDRIVSFRRWRPAPKKSTPDKKPIIPLTGVSLGWLHQPGRIMRYSRLAGRGILLERRPLS